VSLKESGIWRPRKSKHLSMFVTSAKPKSLLARYKDHSTQVEIFDSGTCCHISPYRDAFSNISDISPWSLRAANKQSFSAVGKGDMVIDVPNGSSISQLKLTEVLYSPEAGYTLVFIGHLDEAGFTITCNDLKLKLRLQLRQRLERS